ncbi:hypothetical protein [Lentibacillus jeotgali]|uniref:hypothetical protein n=1 Tax=Lentibacillus jeotgali TaxID=558169 RepID=UPI000262700A|nr:hypothetical protein [Lentibacillus jeotgali]
MAVIEEIVSAYGVSPYHIKQVSDRLYKVSDGQNMYALKESKLTDRTIHVWEQVYHQAYAYNLSAILPVYLTERSDLYVKMGDLYYYLTPWIIDKNPGQERAVTNIYEVLGNVHAKTKQSVSIDTEPIIQQFTRFQKYCAKCQNELLTYVELFEQNRFMSPFELQVCTHYHVLVKVLVELNQLTERLKDELAQEQKWNYSLLHGNPDLSHSIHDHNAYLINWEEAAYDNAVLDLSLLLKRQAQFHNRQNDHWAEMFTVYKDENPLTVSEQYLLSIYLMDPSDYIALVNQYMTNAGQHTMVKHVQLLQRAFRRLEFGFHWTEQIENDASEIESET